VRLTRWGEAEQAEAATSYSIGPVCPASRCLAPCNCPNAVDGQGVPFAYFSIQRQSVYHFIVRVRILVTAIRKGRKETHYNYLKPLKPPNSASRSYS
jgi:hypothetical protein